MSPMTILAAIAIFVAMFLMRLTLRSSQRRRPDGIRWRGIDWSQVQRPPPPAEDEASAPEPEATGGSRSSGSPSSDASGGG